MYISRYSDKKSICVFLKHHQKETCRKVSPAKTRSVFCYIKTVCDSLSIRISRSFCCFLHLWGCFGPVCWRRWVSSLVRKQSRSVCCGSGKSSSSGSTRSKVKSSKVEQTESCRPEFPLMKTDTTTNPATSSASET